MCLLLIIIIKHQSNSLLFGIYNPQLAACYHHIPHKSLSRAVEIDSSNFLTFSSQVSPGSPLVITVFSELLFSIAYWLIRHGEGIAFCVTIPGIMWDSSHIPQLQKKQVKERERSYAIFQAVRLTHDKRVHRQQLLNLLNKMSKTPPSV